MRHFLFMFFWVGFFLTVKGQTSSPKFEFRAVWVATSFNIDWPSKPGLSTEKQQKEIINILETHKDLGMNTIILQVRPSADAIYYSGLEPWSKYLTAIPGKAPDPFYDPLKFWIKECHKRGMELHAWLNPFRVAENFQEPLAGNHIAFQHPEWILKYGKKLYFDPGIPGTKEFVVEVVKDIVSRYDVDAIHFDDYFYPYPIQEEFPDTASFAIYNRGFLAENKDDWRRENVDIIIKTLSDSIKSIKPWVKFGISPFGVWRNSENDPMGSETKAGVTNYDHLYADILKWQKNGWIDYTLPQLYWHIGHPLADFEHLAQWWKKHAYNRGMYIGHSAYKMNSSSSIEEWTNSKELVKQINVIREIPEIGGSSFYSSKHFNRDLMGFQDSLRNHLYKDPAIVPPMNWIDDTPPPPVKKLKRAGKKIKWELFNSVNEMDKPNQVIIYINEAGKKFIPEECGFMLKHPEDKKIRFEKRNKKKRRYELRVSVLDRLSNESQISDPLIIKL